MMKKCCKGLKIRAQKGLVNPYDFGGVLSGIGGAVSMLPGAGTLVGTGLNLIGGMFSGNKKKKEAEKEQEIALMQQKQQQLLAMPKSSEGVTPGVVNPYMLAYGGSLNTYDSGGSHSENPLGGIPAGMGNNGMMNTVEEGEASFDFSDGKYVFSNRLILE